MTHIVVRLLTGTSSRSQDELIGIAGQELAPRLLQAGCQRYNLIKFTDGRMGSVSLFENQEAAERGRHLGETWIRETAAMQGYSVDQTLAGERIFGFQPQQNPNLDDSFGAIRIYNSRASAADVREALEQEARPILQAVGEDLLRYTCIRLDGGDGFLVLTAHRTRESAAKLTEQAAEARQKSGSRLEKVLPQAPQVIEGHIVRSFTSTAG